MFQHIWTIFFGCFGAGRAHVRFASVHMPPSGGGGGGVWTHLCTPSGSVNDGLGGTLEEGVHHPHWRPLVTLPTLQALIALEDRYGFTPPKLFSLMGPDWIETCKCALVASSTTRCGVAAEKLSSSRRFGQQLSVIFRIYGPYTQKAKPFSNKGVQKAAEFFGPHKLRLT